MTRPASPQHRETQSGHTWTWKVPEGIPDVETGEQTVREVELEWLTEKEVWKVRSRVNGAGWTEPLIVHDLDDPESSDHADQLARDYAARPRGGTA